MSSQVLEATIEVIEAITHIENKEIVEKLDDAELWDSHLNVEIVLALEEKFDIFFDDQVLESLASASSFYKAVLVAKGHG